MHLELLENEMFGHEAGAFTGAAGPRAGIIDEANHGTLFLDEVDSFPAQAKLLRFLQDGEFKPLGTGRTRKADVRVIAATNIDIDAALRSHVLREDLYYRLSVTSLHLPPLRERKHDIPLLANSFLLKWATQFGKEVRAISLEAMNLLMLHDWPGNVRELENTVERAVIFATESVVQSEDVVFSLQHEGHHSDTSFRSLKIRFEQAYLKGLISSAHGNITKAAHAAKLDRRTLRLLLRKHRIGVS